MNILVLEPYFGGSHKSFINGLQEHLDFNITLITMPARKWKWRMRLAAPYFAEKISALAKDTFFDAILCSTFVDVATLKSLLPLSLRSLPVFTYFHENQFAYPVQIEDERDFHFGLTNLTTALASDRIAFNTDYNLGTFLEGADKILKICPDMKMEGVREKLIDKATTLYPGIDFRPIDQALISKDHEIPVIVWNHRWEHDKNPDYFFKTLFELKDAGFAFRLIILGQSFRREPSIFCRVREKLRDRILHIGYAESRDEYARLLAQGDIVVSTADHEFYGISVIEAVRAGCCPLLPDRLSYPELFPVEYLYVNGELYNRLKSYLTQPVRLSRSQAFSLTDRFSWPVLKAKYEKWFDWRKT